MTTKDGNEVVEINSAGDEIASGSISFSAGDNLTTEKKSAAISPNSGVFIGKTVKIFFDKPAENTAGDMTVKVYDIDKVDGTNARDGVLITTVVEKITGALTMKPILVESMFNNSAKQAKIGLSFATDSGAIEVSYRIVSQ